MRDGIGNYTWTLANAMKHSGAEIAVVVPRIHAAAPAEVLGALTLAGQGGEHLRLAIRDWKPDVIHVQFAVGAFGTRTLALLRWLGAVTRSMQVPVVITMHEYSRESALLPLVGRALHRHLSTRCDKIVVHTSSAFSAVIDRLGQPVSKVKLIPHPCVAPSPATLSSELRTRFGLGEARVLLAFGFIHVDKGLDDLVRALNIIRRNAPGELDNVRLVVAGAVRRRDGLFRVFEARDKVHLARVLLMVRRYRLQQQFVVTGYVPGSDVAGWFDVAEVAVLPYRRTEQSGVASLAQAFDVPVVASDVGGLAELFKGTSWTFPPAAPERLAETLRRFLATPPKRDGVSAGRRLDNDLASVTARTMDLYRSVAAERGPGAANLA